MPTDFQEALGKLVIQMPHFPWLRQLKSKKQMQRNVLPLQELPPEGFTLEWEGSRIYLTTKVSSEMASL